MRRRPLDRAAFFVGAEKQSRLVARLARRILLGILFLVLALVASVIFAGLKLSNPAAATIGAPPHDLPAEAVTIPSWSGATLRGWFVPGAAGRGGIVLMHGVGASRLSMVRRARLLHGLGFAVLLFDFQAHGESSGDRITFGAREALDAGAAVAYLRARLSPNEPLGALGVSLGGAATLLGAHPLPVDALVLEAVYPDIESALNNRLRAHLGRLAGMILAPIVTPLFEAVLPPFLGVHPDQLRPIDHIAEATAPILIAAGDADDRTTIEESRTLFARAHQPKSLWEVPGAGHVDLEVYAPDAYRAHVIAFLVERLQRAP